MDEQCELLCLDLPRAEALRTRRLQHGAAEAASTRARALADPTRLILAMALRGGGELCGCDLAWILERKQNLVSHHLRVLKTAGLARSRRDRKMVLYSLTEQGQTLLELIAADALAEVVSG
jgi:ArsR family transcriptional regulator, lead/cadmium/zinc/bismuth-responsive transcriptional repressor